MSRSPPGRHPALLQSLSDESIATSVNEAVSTPNPKHGVAAVRINRIVQQDRNSKNRLSNSLKSAAREIQETPEVEAASSFSSSSPSPPHLTVNIPSPSQQERFVWTALWEAYAAATTAQVAADQLYILGLIDNDQYDRMQRATKMAVSYITQQLLLTPGARDKLTKQALAFVAGGAMERSTIGLQSIFTTSSIRAAGSLAAVDAELQKVMIQNEG